MTTIYQETEYRAVTVGSRKIILSVQDKLELGTNTDLDGDLSDIDVVIYARSVVLSKKITAKSIRIYAHSVATVLSQKPLDSNVDRRIILSGASASSDQLSMEIEIFDFTASRHLLLSAVSSSSGALEFHEKISCGADKVDLSQILFAHPDQCSMLLHKAQILYRIGDPVANPDALNQAIAILDQLRDFLKVFHDLKMTDRADDDPPLAALYAKGEKQIGAIDSVKSLINIYATANGLLGQIKKGSDFYGNSYSYVPLASKDFYSSILDKLVDNFSDIESNYFEFVDEKTTDDQRKADLRNAVSNLSQTSAQASDSIDTLKVRAYATADEIKDLESQFKAKKDLVTQRLEEFKDDLEKSFNLNLQSLIPSLTTAAFLKETPAAALVLSGASVAYDISQAASTVENDEGITLQKDYLVEQVKAFEGDLSCDALSEQSKKLNSGTIQLDDPCANKLILEEQKLNDFLKDFTLKFPTSAKALETAFQDYVNLVLERNNKVLYYNAVVTLIVKNHNIVADCAQKKAILDEGNINTYQPSLPAFTALMDSLYTSAQAQVMESLYLTERAFRFWSLSDDKPVTQMFVGNTLGAINSSVLKQAQSTILDRYAKVIEEQKRIPPQNFPFKTDGNGNLSISLSDDQVTTLKEGSDGTYSVLFSIPTVLIDTKKKDSPFAGFSDIRLKQIFVWVDGVKTSDGQLSLTVTHTGDEVVVNADNVQFNFKHNSKPVPIKYDIQKQSLLEGGNIGNDDSDKTFALVGPFTWWNLTIVSDYNVGLDLSQVTGVRMEFQGTNYPFNQS